MRITAEAKQATRQRILDAALNLFRDRGFQDTTTRDLAQEAQIAAGTLFNYFPSKESLALALLTDSVQPAREQSQNRDDRPAGLHEELFALIAAEMRSLRPHRSYLRPVLETSLSPFFEGEDHDADNFRTEHLEIVRQIIARDLGATERDGSFITLHLYWTLYLGVLAFWADDPSPNQEDSLVALDQATRLFAAALPRSNAVEAGTVDAHLDSEE